MNTQEAIEKTLKMFPEKVKKYKTGNVSLMGLFVGEVMILTRGKADPKEAMELIRNKIDND